MNPPAISIVIPCRNEALHIRLTLEAILRQCYDLKDFEIIIVDAMSKDGTRTILDEYKICLPQLCILENKRISTASARNIGIRVSQGEFIALIDGHCEISPDYLSTCYHALRESSEDVACIAGRTRTVASSYIGNAIASAMSSPFGVGNASFRYTEKEMDVDTAAFGVYKRSIFEKIGYYDENLIGAEDDELSLRITSEGYRIRLLPQISARYWARETYWELFKQYYGYGRGKALVLRKHHRIPPWRVFVPPAFVFTLIFSFILGFLWLPLRWFWICTIFLYVLTGIAVSLTTMKRNMFEALAILIAFACIHISYGLGFLCGIIEWILYNYIPSNLHK